MASFSSRVVGSTVALELSDIYDDFTDHEASLAFMCDAVSAMVAHGDQWPTAPGAEGLVLYAQRLRDEATDLGGRLDKVRRLIHPKVAGGHNG